MAKDLSAKDREKLPKKFFAWPGKVGAAVKRRFPSIGRKKKAA